MQMATSLGQTWVICLHQGNEHSVGASKLGAGVRVHRLRPAETSMSETSRDMSDLLKYAFSQTAAMETEQPSIQHSAAIFCMATMY